MHSDLQEAIDFHKAIIDEGGKALVGYDTAKAAVIQFTRSLAVDLAPHNIRVNNIAPGAIMVETLRKMHTGELPSLWPSETEPTGLMNPITKIRSANIPLGRRGEPSDIANAATMGLSNQPSAG